VGGVPEVIQNGENGLLVPAETPSALTRAIRLLLSSPSDAKKLGTRGRETVLERFDETRMLDEYIDLYRGIL
jgi:glycosyltransferase involved in cell wall biosynthesis